jgi:hypothetical protein
VQVIFDDVKARIEHSDWFVNNYPYRPKVHQVDSVRQGHLDSPR